MYNSLDSKTALDIFNEIETIKERLKKQVSVRDDKFFYKRNLQNDDVFQLKKLEHYLANKIMDKSTEWSINFVNSNNEQKEKIFAQWSKVNEINENWFNDVNLITSDDVKYIDSLYNNEQALILNEEPSAHIQENNADQNITYHYFDMKTGQYISEAKYKFKGDPFKKDKKEGGMVAIGLGSVTLVTTVVSAVAFSFVGAALIFAIGIIVSAVIAQKLGQIKGRKEASYLQKNHSPTLFKVNRLDEQVQNSTNISSQSDCKITEKFEKESVNNDVTGPPRH